jgi:hypothetical protein
LNQYRSPGLADILPTATHGLEQSQNGANVTENAVSSGNYAGKAFGFSSRISKGERKVNLHRGRVGVPFGGNKPSARLTL